MLPQHLIIGSGGPTGKRLRSLLLSSRSTIINTTHRPPPASLELEGVRWIHLDLLDIPRGLQTLSPLIENKKLTSLTLFAHPTLSRNRNSLPYGEMTAFSVALEGVKSILDLCLPALDKSVVLTVLPCLTLHKADGYLQARVYFGGLRGLLEEYARSISPKRTCFVNLEVVHIPGESTPHIPAPLLNRMKKNTLGGFPDPDSLAQTILDLTNPPKPWMHGETIRIPDTAFF